MKRPSSRIREDIARLQEQLKQAETREAERIGRIALRAGLGEIIIADTELLAAFEELTGRFRASERKATGKKDTGIDGSASAPNAAVGTGSDAGGTGEA